MKPVQPLILLATMSLFLAPIDPANANQVEITRAEKRFQEYESKHGTSGKQYAYQLMRLANAYQRYGLSEKADKLYRKSYELTLKQNNNSQTVGSLLTWSRDLLVRRANSTKAEHQKNVSKAIKLLQEAKTLSKTLLLTDQMRFAAQKQLILDSTLQIEEQEKRELLGEIRAQAKTVKSPEAAYSLSRVFDWMANRYAYGKQRSVSTAVNLKRESLALIDKMDAKSVLRINAHRSAVRWFRNIGSEEQAQYEAKQLATLMGTSDPAVLFPAPRPCPACGRG